MPSSTEIRTLKAATCLRYLLPVGLAGFVCAPSTASAAFWKSRKTASAPPPAARTNESVNATPGAAPAPREEKVPASVQFNDAFALLMQADDANDRNAPSAALRLYREALAAYASLANRYPDWQAVITRHRIAHCRNQIEVLNRRTNPGAGRVPAAPDAQPPAADAAPPLAGASPLSARAPPPAVLQPAPARLSPEKLGALRSFQEAARRALRGGDVENARNLLAKAVNLDPDDRTTRLLIGLAQCRAGEYESAIHLLEQLVSEDPRDAEACVLLGTTYFGMGRFQDAEETLQQALRLNPRLSQAHYNIAQIRLSSQPPDLKTAGQHYQKALDLGAEPDEQMNFLLILQ